MKAWREVLGKSCSVCSRTATYLVFDKDGNRRGQFCKACSTKELEYLNRKLGWLDRFFGLIGL